MEKQAILVTGASGALGQIVCHDLLTARQTHLIAATRTPGKLASLAESGVEVRRADFDDPLTLQTAFAGADRALIISTDELITPGQRQRQHAAALAAAKRCGVRHVAYTSMPNPITSASIPFAADHAAMEADLRTSGLEYSSLRISWYQENLLAYLPAIVRDGVWYTAAGTGRIAYVARADAAAVAARVVTQDHGLGEVDVAGPEALTIDEIAELVSEATGRPLRVAHVGQERLKAELDRQGVPAAVIPMIVVTEANQAAGQFSASTHAAHALVGQQPKRLAAFFRDHVELLLGSWG
jgi:NAD(P)H dehydrogenase (quinone)